MLSKEEKVLLDLKHIDTKVTLYGVPTKTEVGHLEYKIVATSSIIIIQI